MKFDDCKICKHCGYDLKKEQKYCNYCDVGNTALLNIAEELAKKQQLVKESKTIVLDSTTLKPPRQVLDTNPKTQEPIQKPPKRRILWR